MTRITLQEFTEACTAYVRRTLVAIGVALLLISAYVAVLLANVDPLRRYLTAQTGRQTAEILMALGLLPAVALLFSVLVASEWLSRRDVRLRCPRCAKSIVEWRSVVIASKCCPHCGGEVLTCSTGVTTASRATGPDY